MQNGDHAPANAVETALVSQAPAASALPSELVDNGNLQTPPKRNVGEEMVQKRLRLLTKKIQRFRGYQSKAQSSLNADQIAALASLPALEASQRELEEVAKALEVIAAEQEQKRKKHAEEADRRVEEAKIAAVEEYKAKTLPILARILSLHSALHPKDPSAASFIPPVLPAHLQDIPVADVRQLDQLAETIASGNPADLELAVEQVNGLSNSRLHGLITGTAAEGSAAEEDAAPSFSPELKISDAPKVNAPPTDLAPEAAAAENRPIFGSFEQGPEAADQPVSQTIEPVSATESMSFMQTSEVEPDLGVGAVTAAGGESGQAPPAAANGFDAINFDEPRLDWTADNSDEETATPAASAQAAAEGEPVATGLPPPKDAPNQRGRGGGRRGGPRQGGPREASKPSTPNAVDDDGFQLAQRKSRGQAPQGRGRGGNGRGRGGQGARGARGGAGGERGGPRGVLPGTRVGFAGRPENQANGSA